VTRFQKLALGCLGFAVTIILIALIALIVGLAEGILILEADFGEGRVLSLAGEPRILVSMASPTQTLKLSATPTWTFTPTVVPTPTFTRVVRVVPTSTPVKIVSAPSPTRPTGTPTRKPVAKVSPAKIPATPAAGLSYASAEALVVSLINEYRQEAGVPALARDRDLDEIALARSKDMATRGYFSHEDPAGGTLPLEKLMVDRHIQYKAAGENIAYFLGLDQVDSLPQLAGEKWMASPPHRENLMDPVYGFTGFGIVSAETAQGRIWYLTQVFVQR